MTNRNTQADIHRALSNVDRIAIMDYLASRVDPKRSTNALPQASVTEVAANVGCSATTATKHLTKLAKVGLIVRKQDKQTVWNSIAKGVVWPVVVRL